MKRGFLTLALLGLLLWLAWRGYLAMLPRLELQNASAIAIERALVALPSSRLSFDAIAPGGALGIHHDADQADGPYRYRITLVDGRTIEGDCGQVTGNEFGKRQLISLQRDLSVLCHQAP
ncbi:hypothetical protein [Gallaecimonas sp. GXIMD4217]|uniref:hypothetical protein n=1 Tax=Gallaecimonas sp. GXIMD4217 TaxID=3131927 RepID=UPI00311B2396